MRTHESLFVRDHIPAVYQYECPQCGQAFFLEDEAVRPPPDVQCPMGCPKFILRRPMYSTASDYIAIPASSAKKIL